MQDKPDASTLIEAVSSFLVNVAAPKLEGRDRFHARIAENVLAITAREAQYAGVFEAAQTNRLQNLLSAATDHNATQGETEDDIVILNHSLCQYIVDGKLNLQNSELIQHLIKTTMGKLAINQPNYAGYQKARALGWPEEDGYDGL